MAAFLEFFRFSPIPTSTSTSTSTSPSLESLRANAWRVDGTFLVRITDKRLTEIEREVIRRIAKKLYETN